MSFETIANEASKLPDSQQAKMLFFFLGKMDGFYRHDLDHFYRHDLDHEKSLTKHQALVLADDSLRAVK